MSLYEGSLNTSSLDGGITSIKDVLVNTAGFTAVSDTGTGTSRVVILSHANFAHKIKIYATSSSYHLIVPLKLDDTTALLSMTAGAMYTQTPYYRLVMYGNTIAFFIYYSGVYRSVFVYTKSGDNYIQYFRSGSYSAANALVQAGQGNDTSLSNLGFAKYSTRTASFYQIVAPCYPTIDANTLVMDNPSENLFSFCNATSIADGTKISVGGNSYITSTSHSSSNVEMLIKYA